MSTSTLNRRTQLLLDDELHRRLRESAAQRGISMGALIREAVEEKLASIQDSRDRAIQELLDAEPMPVEDWPIMKRQMIEDMNAGAGGRRRRLHAAAAGRSGQSDVSERVEEIIASEMDASR
jgi:hypothetical protein